MQAEDDPRFLGRAEAPPFVQPTSSLFKGGLLYVVEIRRDREHLAKAMAGIREWLDAQRFEPDAFRTMTDDATVAFRVEFKFEREAKACAEAFGGQMSTIGDKPSA